MEEQHAPNAARGTTMDSYNKINVLSYGGGVNSSALFFYLLKTKRPLDLVIFADTGEETINTYDAVKRMRLECKKRGVEFVKVKSKYGNLYEYYYNNKAVMSIMKRDCTSKFKIAPIRAYLRKKYGKKQKFNMYIGIAFEEWHRCRDSDVKYITNVYPFVDDKIDREGNKAILKQHNFSAVKSGCKGCIYLKKKLWVNMLINNPKEFERHKRLEINNSRYPDITINPNFSLEDLEKRFKNQQSLDLWSDVNPSCDVVGGCFL